MTHFASQVWLLLRVALKNEIGRLGTRGVVARLLLAGLFVLGLATLMLLALTIAQSVSVQFRRSGGPDYELIAAMLAGAFGISGVVLLLAALPFGLATLGGTSDLPILLATPVDPRAVFTQKLLVAAFWEGALTIAFLAPFVTGLGAAAGAGPEYFLFGALFIVLTPLLPLSLGQLIVFGLLRLVSAQVVRTSLGLVGALFGLAISLARLTPGTAIGNRAAGALATVGATGSWWLVPAWPGQALADLLAGDPVGALLVGLPFIVFSVGAFTGSVLLASAVATNGWFDVAGPGLKRRPVRDQPLEVPGSGSRHFQGPARAILVKDWRTIIRDPLVWTRLLGPLLGFGFVFYLLLQRAAGLSGPNASLVRIGSLLLVAGFLAWNLNNRLALSAFNRERKAITWLIASPAPIRQILLGKLLAAVLPEVIVLLPVVTALAIFIDLDPVLVIVNLVATTLLIVALASATLVVGIAFPKFDWSDVRRVSTVPALVASSALQTGVMVLALLVIAGPIGLQGNGVVSPVAGDVLLVGGLAVMATIAGLFLVGLFGWGGRRVERWEIAQ